MQRRKLGKVLQAGFAELSTMATMVCDCCFVPQQERERLPVELGAQPLSVLICILYRYMCTVVYKYTQPHITLVNLGNLVKWLMLSAPRPGANIDMVVDNGFGGEATEIKCQLDRLNG